MTDVDISLSTGRVRGIVRDGVARFLGIPYAEDPVGERRFAAPIPRSAWQDTRDATRPAATAQRLRFDPDPAIPEPIVAGTDVLHVDVWAPAEGAGHPVMVWIHGGGWESGSSNQPWFDGAAFARHGVVVVSVGYRLGVEGFTSFPDAPDNRGMLDWIAALEWVRSEISAFGGDPHRVTVAGQSAGGGAVLCLLGSPVAAGLFQRAIAASPAVLRAPSTAAPEGVTAASLAAGGRGAVDEFHRRMRKENQFTLPFRPVVGDELLPAPPLEAVAGGRASEVPLMIGSTATEFEAIADRLPGPALVPGAALIALSQQIPRAGLRALARQSNGRSLRRSVGAVIDAAAIHSTVARAAETRLAAGDPTWVYDFCWADGNGPRHCADLPFFWGSPDAENVERYLGAPAPGALVTAMHQSWVRFVTDGDPGFAAYEATRRAVMSWDTPQSVVEDGLSAVRQVWWPEEAR
ncbi:carboxylesterase/lipase family protein [Dietzia sp. NPDC055340]